MTISNPTSTSYNPGSAFTPTSGYGWRINPITDASEFHPGQDYSAVSGTYIPAASAGVVYYSGFNASYGNTVVIKSTSVDIGNIYTQYSHKNGVGLPPVGAIVGQGDSIGQVGSTGLSTRPHLHFDVLSGDAPFRSAPGGPMGFTSKEISYRFDPNVFSGWTTGGTPAFDTRSPLSRYPGFADIRPTMPADQDPRRLDNLTSSQSISFTDDLSSALATSEASNRAQARVRMEQAVAASAAAAAVVAAERDRVEAQAFVAAINTQVPGGSSSYHWSESDRFSPYQGSDGSLQTDAKSFGNYSHFAPVVIDLNGDGIKL